MASQGPEPLVWTPDKRMILQSAVADLSPDAFQSIVGKVFGPATLAMRRRWSPRDVDFEGLENGDLQRISASRNGGQPVPQIDLGFNDDKQEDPQTHHPGRVSRDVKRSVRANVGAEDFDVEQCCAKCGKWDFGAGSDVSLKRCARCLTIYYCSPACQKEHWSQHKKHCKRLKKERDAAKGLTGAMAAASIS